MWVLSQELGPISPLSRYNGCPLHACRLEANSQLGWTREIALVFLVCGCYIGGADHDEGEDKQVLAGLACLTIADPLSSLNDV